ncbi:uncharacterized protein LOC128387411 [Panonychus citri]|uniref:uncharacterized protein LOC128387411 n=1 Tax=Panonychus citri TaxID=50023 RepID=UPI002307C045|nr:uncharacterized protein LOC128387411 [Panonychus citri]
MHKHRQSYHPDAKEANDIWVDLTPEELENRSKNWRDQMENRNKQAKSPRKKVNRKETSREFVSDSSSSENEAECSYEPRKTNKAAKVTEASESEVPKATSDLLEAEAVVSFQDEPPEVNLSTAPSASESPSDTSFSTVTVEPSAISDKPPQTATTTIEKSTSDLGDKSTVVTTKEKHPSDEASMQVKAKPLAVERTSQPKQTLGGKGRGKAGLKCFRKYALKQAKNHTQRLSAVEKGIADLKNTIAGIPGISDELNLSESSSEFSSGDEYEPEEDQ